MKAVKLIVVFAIILGVVLAIYSLTSKIDNGGTSITFAHTSEYNKLSEDIDKSWNDSGDWNKDLYEDLWQRAKQLHPQQNINTDNLIDKNTNSALKIVKDKIFAEWNKPNCRDAEVRRYKDAVDFVVSKDKKATKEPMVKDINRVYGEYAKARNFVDKNIGLSPNFNGSSWNSFSLYETGITNQKNEIKNNSDYTTYLSNITAIKKGLVAVDTNLKTAKSKFYSKLAQEIIYYYKDRDRTQIELDKLREIRGEYEREHSSNPELDRFVTKFSNEVNENQISSNGRL